MTYAAEKTNLENCVMVQKAYVYVGFSSVIF